MDSAAACLKYTGTSIVLSVQWMQGRYWILSKNVHCLLQRRAHVLLFVWVSVCIVAILYSAHVCAPRPSGQSKRFDVVCESSYGWSSSHFVSRESNLSATFPRSWASRFCCFTSASPCQVRSHVATCESEVVHCYGKQALRHQPQTEPGSSYTAVR